MECTFVWIEKHSIEGVSVDFFKQHKFISDVPAPPSDIRLTDLSSRSIEIAWAEPHDGNSPILNYVIEYSNLPGKIYIILVSKNDTLMVWKIRKKKNLKTSLSDMKPR